MFSMKIPCNTILFKNTWGAKGAMQKSHFLNSLDFALVVSVFVAVCSGIFSNIIVKLNSSLRKRSLTFCGFFFLQ